MKDHTIRCLKTLSCLPRYPGRITTPEIHRRLEVVRVVHEALCCRIEYIGLFLLVRYSLQVTCHVCSLIESGNNRFNNQNVFQRSGRNP